MSPLQWTIVCVIFTFYLLFGGVIFMVLEQHHEIHQKEEMSILRQDIQEILLRLDRDFYHNGTSNEVLDALKVAKEGVINRISMACGGDNLLEQNADSSSSSLRWNFYNSVFFAFTVITTIGYGHLSPSTSWSKMFILFYALVGIPINGILLSGLGDYFSSKLVRIHKRSKERKYRGKITLIFEIIFYLIPGIVVFLIIPAGLFVLIESWTFLDALYFTFVSLTTIGFGDYVAGMGDGHNVWLWMYKVAIIVWIIFGLGYLVMILGFITKGLKSKKVRVVLEKRLNRIRTTKEKLTRDVEYMRRVVNELYLMKIKPVYNEEDQIESFKAKAERALSQPCLLPRKYSTLPRKSTASQIPILVRRCSDSDLQNIDKEKTFGNFTRENLVSPEELLATVVNALSGNVMGNVMDAVEELNYEEHRIAEEEEQSGSDSPDEDDPEVGAQSWELGLVTESDEEVLIDEDENDSECKLSGTGSTLEQVVVHNSNAEQYKQPPQSFMGKVTDAIRKISTGAANKSCAEESSRKASRNESDRGRKFSRKISNQTVGSSSRKVSRNDTERKISKNELERKISDHNHYYHVNSYEAELYGDGHLKHLDLGHEVAANYFQYNSNDRRLSVSQNRKISEQSRISNSLSNTANDGIGDGSSRSRKITPDSEDHERKISLEKTSLANFLKALDAVHDKLKSTDTEIMEESDESDSFSYPSTLSPVAGSPKLNRNPLAFEVTRRRKIGVFNPQFSYQNRGFTSDAEEESHKDLDNIK